MIDNTSFEQYKKYKEYVEVDDAYEAEDLEMRDLAWQIHVKICKGASLEELDKYVTDIVNF